MRTVTKVNQIVKLPANPALLLLLLLFISWQISRQWIMWHHEAEVRLQQWFGEVLLVVWLLCNQSPSFKCPHRVKISLKASFWAYVLILKDSEEQQLVHVSANLAVSLKWVCARFPQILSKQGFSLQIWSKLYPAHIPVWAFNLARQ